MEWRNYLRAGQWPLGETGRCTTGRDQKPTKWAETGTKDDRNCDGRTVLGELWRARVRTDKQEQPTEDIDVV